MILTVDVGNTTIMGALYEDKKNLCMFRHATTASITSDEFGLFLRNIIQLNGFDYSKIKKIACCSVVPSLNHSISNAFIKYFGIEALFVQAGIKTGLKLKYSNPKEIGADIIAGNVGANYLYPEKNIVVVDMGTATTVVAVSKECEFVGGTILPGINMCVKALATGTAKLPAVEIIKPEVSCGKSTIEAIQSGIFYGHKGAIKEIISMFEKDVFKNEKPLVIATGGLSKLFENDNLFDEIIPDLVNIGLLRLLEIN